MPQSRLPAFKSLAIALNGKGFATFKRIWTIGKRYGVTPAKMDWALELLTKTLQEFNCQGTFPVIATVMAQYSTIFQKYQAKGIEFAIHGLVHVDHTQLSLNDQRTQFSQAQQMFAKANIPFTGFRCPYLRWNADTITALNEYDFAYDGSQALAWDVVNGYETTLYHRGLDFYRSWLAVDYPALPWISGNIVRIPYCLPDDEALIERLQLTHPGAMAEIWLEMLARTYNMGELFTLGLHPERTMLCYQALWMVLERARSLSVWIARLDEIATWWRALSEATFNVTEKNDGLFQLEINAPPHATILVRGVDVEASLQPWANNYQRVLSNKFSLRNHKRPFIGLSPDSAPTLLNFLRQQGYLVEISPSAEFYPFYLNRASFTRKDERPLLAQIEKEDWPLVRLGRWPDGAQSALSITGDIDAFTVWDYGARIWGG